MNGRTAARVLLATVLLATVPLVGCMNQAKALIVTPDEEAFARQSFDLLRQRRFAELEQTLAPESVIPGTHDQLEKMSAEVPPGNPTSVKFISGARDRDNELTKIVLTQEYEFQGTWLLVTTNLTKKGDQLLVTGLHVKREALPLEKQNPFELGGRLGIEYVILALVVLLPLFTIAVFVLCVRTPLNGPKWPWLLFIPLGVGRFTENWSAGAFQVNLFSVTLLSAEVHKLFGGPWLLTISFPLAAVCFLLLRKRLMKAPAVLEPGPAPPA